MKGLCCARKGGYLKERANGQRDEGVEPWKPKLLVPTESYSPQAVPVALKPLPLLSGAAESHFLKVRHLQWGPGLCAALGNSYFIYVQR